MSYVRRLRRAYGLKKLGLLPVLMNRGDYNLCGYSRMFQPGGSLFGAEYRFLGPLSVHRRTVERNDFSCPEPASGERLIYISLGTIFNENEGLLREIIRQFGRNFEEGGTLGERSFGKALNAAARGPGKGGKRDLGDGGNAFHEGRDAGKQSFRVVLVCEKNRRFPDNFIVRPFVDQSAVLRHADLFITAGGVNSIHEALYFGVPCLLCPQQGEQLLNAERFQRLGFGRILGDTATLRQEALECMELRKNWKEKRRAAMTAVHMGEVLEIMEGLQKNAAAQSGAVRRGGKPYSRIAPFLYCGSGCGG